MIELDGVAIFRAVVGCNDFVFGDRELRKRIAGIAVRSRSRAARDARAAAE